MNLYTLGGLALTGTLAGGVLATTTLIWGLWRVATSQDVSASSAMAARTGGGPVLHPLDAAALRDLRARRLEFPVEGVTRETLIDSFGDIRGAGSRRHHAVDIMAPRRAAVRAVEDGVVARLDNSPAGGISLYQFDPTEQYCYYYAHLDAYASGLKQGAKVERGQLLGYVGTTGNAPRHAPHLHFAIFRLSDARQWWAGTALNPYPIFR